MYAGMAKPQGRAQAKTRCQARPIMGPAQPALGPCPCFAGLAPSTLTAPVEFRHLLESLTLTRSPLDGSSLS